jgi:hypothetical protein
VWPRRRAVRWRSRFPPAAAKVTKEYEPACTVGIVTRLATTVI